jgi:hypothetical protein
MNTDQIPVEFPEVQGAIYGVALSLDSFLLNGIPYGVLQQSVFPGFLEKVADNLLRDLTSLERHALHAPDLDQPRIREVLAALRGKCQELIDLVSGLVAFRSLPIEQVRGIVSVVPLLRDECVQLVQELEGLFQTPKPFYQSCPSHSTATINEFLVDLGRMFEEEWAASKVGAG